MYAEFGTGQVFWSMVWFTLFFIWIWMLFAVFADIFRSRDLSGWGKALWSLFVIFLPYLGVFTYLIARGHKMGQHAADDARAQDEAFRSYVRDVVAETPTAADSLGQLTALHDQGYIDDEEYGRMKAKILS